MSLLIDTVSTSDVREGVSFFDCAWIDVIRWLWGGDEEGGGGGGVSLFPVAVDPGRVGRGMGMGRVGEGKFSVFPVVDPGIAGRGMGIGRVGGGGGDNVSLSVDLEVLIPIEAGGSTDGGATVD